MTNDPRSLAETYMSSWWSKDFDTLRSILADDVSFEGPLATLTGADRAIEGLRGMAGGMTGLEVKKILSDDTDVITFFELRMGDSPALPTANWSHVEDGRITAIRVAFDPRPILG